VVAGQRRLVLRDGRIEIYIFAYRIGDARARIVRAPPNAVYTIDFAARLSDLPRRTVLVCCKYGLVAPMTDDAAGGYYFNSAAIQVLRHVALLRDVCGDDLAGIKIILDLTNALERLQAQLRAMSQGPTLDKTEERARGNGQTNSFRSTKLTTNLRRKIK
jgi:MerR family transcriptional regulator/heat shock protein HspR